ncbi:MAG: hypothetical protein V2A72_06265 [Candidatus Omnitrophota bacterium]
MNKAQYTATEVLFFVISCIVILAAFLITRLPFFLYYPVPSFTPDYAGYYALVDKILNGSLPVFDARTPGYPLFLSLILFFIPNLIAVIFIQNVITFVSLAVFIYAIWKTYKYISLAVSIALAAFISSGLHVDSDTTLLSESLYVNCLILFFAFIVLALHSRKKIFFLFSSLFAGCIIYIRPSGLFLIPVFLIMILYIIWNSYCTKSILCFVMPVLIMVLSLSAYNFFTTKVFAVNLFGESAMVLTTSTFLETDSQYPKPMNEAINKIRDRVAAQDRYAMKHSWDLIDFNMRINTLKYWDNSSVFKPLAEATEDMPEDEAKLIYRRIYRDAIRKNFDVYIKLVLTNLMRYFYTYSTFDYNLYTEISNRYKLLYIDKNYQSKSPEHLRRGLLREYFNPSLLSTMEVMHTEDGGASVKCKSLPMQQAHLWYVSHIQYPLFRKAFWPLLTGIVFIISTCLCLYSRFRDLNAFILFCFTFSLFCAGLLTSIANFTLVRYSYTTEFIYYITIALFPTLFINTKKYQ